MLSGKFWSWEKSRAKAHPDRRHFEKVLYENDLKIKDKPEKTNYTETQKSKNSTLKQSLYSKRTRSARGSDYRPIEWQQKIYPKISWDYPFNTVKILWHCEKNLDNIKDDIKIIIFTVLSNTVSFYKGRKIHTCFWNYKLILLHFCWEYNSELSKP
jgi:hypothetical protein